jgi:RimJ/RimL family protein N-acetyltransferase
LENIIVKLRSFKDQDLDLLVFYLNKEEVTKHITAAIPKPYTKNDAQWWINNSKSSAHIKAIEINGKFVGCISAKIGDFEYSCGAEIGYWVGNDFWNQGIATEAVRLFSESLFTSTDLIRLFVSVVSLNIGSIRVLEKNGFSLEGVLKKASFKHGEYFDEHLLSKIKT